MYEEVIAIMRIVSINGWFVAAVVIYYIVLR